MTMTREEAIALFEKQLTAAQVVLDSGFGSNPGENNILYRRRKEMAEIALSALRPVSREQVEKVWPGCPYCKEDGEGYVQKFGAYSIQNGEVTTGHCKPQKIKFCPHCSRPLTDEAVEMVMERLEALHEHNA